MKQTDATNLTATLFHVVDEFDESALAALLQTPLNIDARNADGVTALQVAIRDNFVDGALMLIKGGASVDLAGEEGGNLLHDAAWCTALTKALLAKGLDACARDDNGLEPIHIAARFGSIGALDALIEAGASIRSRAAGKSVLQYAEENSEPDLLDALIARGASRASRMAMR